MSMKKTGKLVQIDNPKSDVAIKVEHVSKSFRLPHNRQSSLKGALVNLVSGGDRTFETQEVLKDISFEIKKGEFFGIVGRNGSGKSTLLKMLAGIYTPTHGTVTVNGSLTPFIELGVGFNPELTGRENVFMNGALLGFNDKEVAAMYDDIVSFAELERFMDQKLKNYSSGMQVRLAFSIAIRARSDILLLDEVLAVGDEAFQRKCFNYFETLKRLKKTVILVTHDMSSVERFCTKGMFVEDGQVKLIGSAKSVAAAYSQSNDDGYIVENIESMIGSEAEDEEQETYNLEIATFDKSNRKKSKFISGETMLVKMNWQNPTVKEVSVSIVKQTGETIFGAGTYQDGHGLSSPNQAEFAVDLNLSEGTYFIQVGLGAEGIPKPIVFIDHGPDFVINKDKSAPRWDGLTKLSHYWS